MLPFYVAPPHTHTHARAPFVDMSQWKGLWECSAPEQTRSDQGHNQGKAGLAGTALQWGRRVSL